MRPQNEARAEVGTGARAASANTASVSRVAVVTPEELRALVRDEVRAALADVAPAPAKASPLVDRRELARLLDVSAATVTRLTAEGMPCTHVGDSPRYDVEAVRAWLNARGPKPTKAAPTKALTPVAGVRLLSRGGR